VNQDDIKNLIDEFIKFVEFGSLEPTTRNRNLMKFLDNLGLSQAYLSITFDENNYSEPPRKNQTELRKVIEKNFPEYGYYNVALTVTDKIGEAEIGVGDAIDDIVDIYIDLCEVQWRWENTSIDDALWHYNNSYKAHWGEHLRDLQRYVYHLQHSE
jgi:hypothetical protein